MTGLLEGIRDQPGGVLLEFWAGLPHWGVSRGHRTKLCCHTFLRPRIRNVPSVDARVVAETGVREREAEFIEWRLFDGSIWTPLIIGSPGPRQPDGRKATLDYARSLGRSTLWSCHHPYTSSRIPHHLFGVPDGWDGSRVFGSEHFIHMRADKSVVVADGVEELIAEAQATTERNLIMIDGLLWRRSGEPVIEMTIESGTFLSMKTKSAQPAPTSPLVTRFGVDQREEALELRKALRRQVTPHRLPETVVYDRSAFVRDNDLGPVLEARAACLAAASLGHLGRLSTSAIAAMRDLRALGEVDASSAGVATRLMFDLGREVGIDETTAVEAQAPLRHDECEPEDPLRQALLLPLKRLKAPAAAVQGDELALT